MSLSTFAGGGLFGSPSQCLILSMLSKSSSSSGGLSSPCGGLSPPVLPPSPPDGLSCGSLPSSLPAFSSFGLLSFLSLFSICSFSSLIFSIISCAVFGGTSSFFSSSRFFSSISARFSIFSFISCSFS